MAEVVLDKVNKQYENGFHAVQDLDLDIADGEFLVLVGPSGLRQVHGPADGRRARGHQQRHAAASATAWSTRCPRASATSPWCSSRTRSTRT